MRYYLSYIIQHKNSTLIRHGCYLYNNPISCPEELLPNGNAHYFCTLNEKENNNLPFDKERHELIITNIIPFNS